MNKITTNINQTVSKFREFYYLMMKSHFSITLFLFLIGNSIIRILEMKNPNFNDISTNLVKYYEVQKHMQNHDNRIKNVQPTLRSNVEPLFRSNGHIKKQPLAQFNRIMTIDIENKALLKKLTDKSPSRIGKEKPYKLIKNNRRKNEEQYKKNIQNAGLFKRIRQVKSSYQNGKFASERKITERYIKTISKYGPRVVMHIKSSIAQKQRGKQGQDNERREKKCANASQAKGFQQENERIIEIQSKKMIFEGKWAQITCVVWSNKAIVQINYNSQDLVKLQVQKQIFSQCFHNRIWSLFHAIKYQASDCTFYLDLPKPKIK